MFSTVDCLDPLEHTNMMCSSRCTRRKRVSGDSHYVSTENFHEIKITEHQE